MGTEAGWAAACAVIETRDPHCRGIVILGLGEGEAVLAQSFAAAARHPRVKGFAVGRTIHAGASRDWLAGTIDDETAVARMADSFARLCNTWDRARNTGETA
jgi:5-dehydro-2-deoxygluconokinase